MTKNIALLVDSGMDLPPEYLAKPGVYAVPLSVIYKDKTYTDKVDITSAEIYERLTTEIPSTSLPQGETIQHIFDTIIADGYEQVVIATISSGLSGTNNIMKIMADDHPTLEAVIIDTKSIGIGGGVQGAYAKDLIDRGLNLLEIKSVLDGNVSQSRVYFSIPTLEYLKKGGRIGLVSSILGTTLNLHPVISCNEDGIYHTVSKARGRKRSIEKMVKTLSDFIGAHASYDIGVAYGNCKEEAEELAAVLKKQFPHFNNFFFDEVSPALGIHTGPGVIGIGAMLR